jgi:membrane fusion protein (multidrug efflux system)
MSTTFDIGLETVARPKSRLAAIPRRAFVVAAAAIALIALGAWWIALPASSVSTDDAYVKADSTIVAPKIQGLVSRILVRDNQHVVAGQPLIRIDPEDYQQAVMAAQADLESAQATLSQQDAQQALAAANTRAAEATIRSSDAESARAEADNRRYAQLVADGYVSHSQAEQIHATSVEDSANSEKSRASLAASRQQETVVARTRAQLQAAA